MAEMIVETAIVTANWRKNWPRDPAQEAARHEHRAEHQRDGQDRAGDLLHRLDRGRPRVQAGRDQPLDVLQHDDGVVDHDADGQHQAEQRQVVELKPIAAMTAKVPISETGTSIIGRIMAFQSCRNTSTTMPTRITASRRVLKTSLTDSRMNGVVS